MTGTPLLFAGSVVAGLSLGCAGGEEEFVTGNLVAPPTVQLCVDATPPEATVKVDGGALGEDGCVMVMEGDVAITAEAEGYDAHEETLQVTAEMKHSVALTKTVTEPPPEEDKTGKRERGGTDRVRGKRGR